MDIGKLFNFNENPNRSDPFLVTPSLHKKSLAAGIGGIRAM
jgi:hypothetical protein